MAVGLLSGMPSFAQAPSLAARELFLRELNQTLLGTDGSPVLLPPNRGWRGVLLAPPGTPLSSTMTPFEALGHDTVSVSKLLEANSQFDSSVFVHDGVALRGAVSMASVWDAVLTETRPSSQGFESDYEMDGWLFREADEVDKLRGVEFVREPSPFLEQYREYQLLFRLLLSAEQTQSGSWRLQPMLAKYSTIEEAKKCITRDWILYGHKVEVEAAFAEFERRSSLKDWLEWSDASEAFVQDRVELSPSRWVPITVLFPPPSEWLAMANWMRGTALLPGTERRVEFQFARVQVLRPWFAVEKLLDGKMRPSRMDGVVGRLSDGLIPTVLSYPVGSLAVYPEELVLVRGIRFLEGAAGSEQEVAADFSHPLGLYFYPDKVNLLGYVVRALPALGLEGAVSSETQN